MEEANASIDAGEVPTSWIISWSLSRPMAFMIMTSGTSSLSVLTLERKRQEESEGMRTVDVEWGEGKETRMKDISVGEQRESRERQGERGRKRQGEAGRGRERQRETGEVGRGLHCRTKDSSS